MAEDTAKRSAIMKRVKSKNTKPEMIVRKLVFAMRYRYRLHGSALSGKPDLVFAGRRKVIFVHGCFWHGHDCRAGQNTPGSNRSYWDAKLARNVERDKANQKALKGQGWDVLIIWECETRDKATLEKRLRRFLGPVVHKGE